MLWFQENEVLVHPECEWTPRGNHSESKLIGALIPLNNSESLMEIRSSVPQLFWVTQYSASYSRVLKNNNEVKGKIYFNGIYILLGAFLGMKFPTSWQLLPLWRDKGEWEGKKKSIFKSETARNFSWGVPVLTGLWMCLAFQRTLVLREDILSKQLIRNHTARFS